jgi:hypothetical protein
MSLNSDNLYYLYKVSLYWLTSYINNVSSIYGPNDIKLNVIHLGICNKFYDIQKKFHLCNKSLGLRPSMSTFVATMQKAEFSGDEIMPQYYKQAL